MTQPVLACRASNKGVLVIDTTRGTNVFHSNQRRKGYQFTGEVTEDEQFIRYCLTGLKRMTPQELHALHPDQIRAIDQLHKKALSRIIRLKGEIAKSWSKQVLKPFEQKHKACVQELIIDDIREIQLDIDIPRPILLHELFKLRREVRVEILSYKP